MAIAVPAQPIKQAGAFNSLDAPPTTDEASALKLIFSPTNPILALDNAKTNDDYSLALGANRWLLVVVSPPQPSLAVLFKRVAALQLANLMLLLISSCAEQQQHQPNGLTNN
jgi:hypothetical protein